MFLESSIEFTPFSDFICLFVWIVNLVVFVVIIDFSYLRKIE